MVAAACHPSVWSCVTEAAVLPTLLRAGWSGGMGGIEHVSEGIIADLVARLPRKRKPQRAKLALLVATMLEARSANLMDLAAALPRGTERLDMRYQWIERLLANPRLEVDAVMAPYARELLGRAAASGQRLPPIPLQTRATAHHQVLMLGLRVGGRALPLAWRVRETRGSIGFAEQEGLVRLVAAWLPAGAGAVLMGDRFYGSPDLILLCRSLGWDYRLRLKGDLLVTVEGGETTTGECATRGERLLPEVGLTAREVPTNIAIVHEPDHPEPWIIAMSERPSAYRAFDYGLRWGIEAMFSDFEPEGFGLEESQIRHADRLARLLLVMALALHWAVSAGMWDAAVHPAPRRKKPVEARPRKLARRLTSLFKRGLRRIRRLFQFLAPIPPLWGVWRN